MFDLFKTLTNIVEAAQETVNEAFFPQDNKDSKVAPPPLRKDIAQDTSSNLSTNDLQLVAYGSSAKAISEALLHERNALIIKNQNLENITKIDEAFIAGRKDAFRELVTQKSSEENALEVYKKSRTVFDQFHKDREPAEESQEKIGSNMESDIKESSEKIFHKTLNDSISSAIEKNTQQGSQLSGVMNLITFATLGQDNADKMNKAAINISKSLQNVSVLMVDEQVRQELSDALRYSSKQDVQLSEKSELNKKLAEKFLQGARQGSQTNSPQNYPPPSTEGPKQQPDSIFDIVRNLVANSSRSDSPTTPPTSSRSGPGR